MQVFFVEDKTMPGWSVVLKKEARGKRIASTGFEHGLGQEESSGDRAILPGMEMEWGEAGDENIVSDGAQHPRSERRRD